MKTNISISVDKDIVDEFTAMARDLGTNRTNLLNMLMVNAIKSPEFSVKRKYCDVKVENFTKQEEDYITNLDSYKNLDDTISKINF